ncbi:restriction endonuclease [Paenibacillus dendritiformis]|uniref:restriction endonuclease n=1 Tax=Paenibacillus dendritiformis TaxID=130049 RepID=UPI00248C3BF5|nr:restriction endonuclease [Paenibacillus dendritiformis]WGU96426.1 restriction endonuclease [Paenibacillus dendritiformis]
MFLFVNFDSPSESKAYDKGKLFERLFNVIVHHVGYTEISLRQKRDNLEYDIIASNKLTNKKLIGEAKAYEKKISEQIITFYGKMALFWAEDPNTLGIFISISELTPDVKGHVDKLTKLNPNFRYIVADQIIDLLSTHANYSNLNQIKSESEKKTGLKAGETYLLVSDRGDYYIQLLIPKEMTLPLYYCVYDSFGNNIEDTQFLELLKNNIDVLKELNALEHKQSLQNDIQLENEKDNFLGVLSGTGWFDYLFPAPPDKFIGREAIIAKLVTLFDSVREGETNTRVCQILSRSGVGKSSITLKLENNANLNGDAGIGVDSRNIRTETDLLNIFQMLTKKINSMFGTSISLPSNQKEITRSIQESEKVLKVHNKIAIIFLDQFESVFSRPKIYNQIIDYILEFCSFNFRLLFCIARKNDQPTTYDESSEIDLNRLNGISKSFLLEDFRLPEAEFLIDKMKEELGRPLIKALKEQVLEISNGFPWLLKKFCAHIIKLVKSGKTQTNVMQTGMQLEDLFNEDLEALDEVLREFFNRLIHYLPATGLIMVDTSVAG